MRSAPLGSPARGVVGMEAVRGRSNSLEAVLQGGRGARDGHRSRT